MRTLEDEGKKAWLDWWNRCNEKGATNMPPSVHFGAGFKANCEFLQLVANACESAEKEVERLRDIEQQRDELLAALKAALSSVLDGDGLTHEQVSAFKRVITKAES